MFRIEISPDALNELSNLDEPIKHRITDKIEWLAINALAVTHHHLTKSTTTFKRSLQKTGRRLPDFILDLP